MLNLHICAGWISYLRTNQLCQEDNLNIIDALPLVVIQCNMLKLIVPCSIAQNGLDLRDDQYGAYIPHTILINHHVPNI